jgi:hypothetical protein
VLVPVVEAICSASMNSAEYVSLRGLLWWVWASASRTGSQVTSRLDIFVMKMTRTFL